MNEKKLPSWISFRVKPDEYEKINDLFSKSTSQKLSEYARNVLLQKPVHIKMRNESADEFLNEMLQLKKELNAIGNNYNQVVRKLHTINYIEEMRSWLFIHDELHKQFLLLTENIYQQMNQIHTLWSPENSSGNASKTPLDKSYPRSEIMAVTPQRL